MFPDGVTDVLGCRRLTLSGCDVWSVVFCSCGQTCSTTRWRMRSCAHVRGLWGASDCSETEWWGMQSRACRPMLADVAPYYPVVVVAGCVTQGTAGRDKQALAGVGGRTGSLVRKRQKSVGLVSGRDLIVWRLARSGAQYCAPKATLEDHIALEMKPSGLNAPRTNHSECHTFRAPLSGFPCIMCIPLNATNT